MTRLFSKDSTVLNKERIYKAFPNALNEDVKVVLEVIPFDEQNIKLSDGNIHRVSDFMSENAFSVKLGTEDLNIPYRVYFNEPTAESENILNERQRAILNCIYTRHHNGYIREQRLQQLVRHDELWITPYTVQLLGEYVYEILEVIDKHVSSKTSKNYTTFIKTNPTYWLKTESRMISNWNEHYRIKYPKLKKYLGYEIVKRIKTSTKNS